MPSIDASGNNHGQQLLQSVVTLDTFFKLLPTQHDNPAFRAKFFPLCAEEVARIRAIALELAGESQ